MSKYYYKGIDIATLVANGNTTNNAYGYTSFPGQAINVANGSTTTNGASCAYNSLELNNNYTTFGYKYQTNVDLVNVFGKLAITSQYTSTTTINSASFLGNNASFVIIGGGGAGGAAFGVGAFSGGATGGGGGSGQAIYTSEISLANFTSLTLTVGGGGTGSNTTNGNAGGASSVVSSGNSNINYTANGGNGGGKWNYNNTNGTVVGGNAGNNPGNSNIYSNILYNNAIGGYTLPVWNGFPPGPNIIGVSGGGGGGHSYNANESVNLFPINYGNGGRGGGYNGGNYNFSGDTLIGTNSKSNNPGNGGSGYIKIIWHKSL